METEQSDLALVVAYLILLVLNITGNAIVIYLVYKKQRTSTDYLLLNLSVSDVGVGIFLLPFYLFPLIGDYNPVLRGAIVCKFLTSGNTAWIMTAVSVNTMTVLSLERYFAVCRPYSFKYWFSKQKIVVMLILVWAAAILGIIPLFTADKCYMEKGSNYTKVYFTSTMAFGAGLLVFLTSISIKIYLSLWCKQSTIQPTALREIEERKKKKKVTMCVLAVIATYIVCYIPQFVLKIVEGYSKSENNLENYLKITQFLIAVNSALDPFLFSLQGSDFKLLFKKLLCKTTTRLNPQQRTNSCRSNRETDNTTRTLDEQTN